MCYARMDKYDVHKARSQTQIQIPAVYEYEVQQVEAQIQIQKQICSKDMLFYFPWKNIFLQVETINDSYMVASGLPVRNGEKHVAEVTTNTLWNTTFAFAFKDRSPGPWPDGSHPWCPTTS